MALTGGLAPNGKAALLAMQIWESDINAKGGLLGRPVKLIYYDDQSNPATIPGIYTKLLDVDKVDLVVSGYATNMIAPAMPIIMQTQPHVPRRCSVSRRTPSSTTRTTSLSHRPAARSRSRVSRAASSPWRWRKTPSRRRWPSSARTPNSRITRWMARAFGEAERPEDRLRQDLSADDDGLLADRSRDPGDQSGPGAGLLLPAGYRRHDPRRQ